MFSADRKHTDKNKSQLLQIANHKIFDLEARLCQAQDQIDALEKKIVDLTKANADLAKIVKDSVWAQEKSAELEWLQRESKNISDDRDDEPLVVSMDRKKSVIDDMILQNLRIYKEDIQLTNMVGKGSFGVVWKANYGDQVVAVKVFVSKDIDVNREVNTMAKVSGQPHVLDLIGVVLEEEDPYKPPQVALVMKFMANGSLQDLCYQASACAISNTTKIRFCYQAARGVQHLHARNIIHRDLASRNLLVDDRMDVFVADFGFARLKQLSSSKDQTATKVGPVRWEAPEALEYKVYSEKTDSFSFGVCVYEIVAGREPWSRCTTSAMVILNVLKGKRMQLPINCDPVLAHVAAQCWAHHPDARPDFTSIVDKLGRRLQEVDEDNREAEHEVRAVEFMINGANVLKFPFVLKELNRGKKPQQRFVRLTSDLKSLLWRSFTANTVFSSARSKATERGINMSDVTGITEGQDTDNFRLFPTASSRRANSLSFSLITGDRTVDIQCESTGERNLWVWGLRFLLSRLRPSPRLQMVRMLVDEPHTLDTEDGLRDHLTAMRMVAYWLRRGELMIKYTSRKTHARHVCLSPDLTQILWGSEEDGPLRKGRNKSINLSDINSIVLGTQPRLISGSARVAAAAAQLADKLTFFRHPSTPLTVQNLSHNATARGKLTAESDELAFVQKPPKSANEKKHNSMRRHSVKSSVASVDDSLPLPALERRWSDDSHFSDTTLGSGAYHDESDYQLCVSYVAVDGRTLLALRCPNDDVLKIWSDGLAKLMMALRKCREDSGPEYNSASELAASSVENGGKWLNMKEYNVVVTPVSGAVAPRGKGVGSEYGELDDMSIGSASTVDVTDGASEKSGSHLSMGRKAAKKGFQPERRSVKRNHLGPLGEVAEETYVAMRAQSDWQVGEHGSWNDPALIPHRSEGKDQRKCDGTMLELKLSEDELDEIREMQRKGSETTVQSPYIAMPTSVGVVTAAGASRHVLNEPIGQERNHSTRDC